MIQRSRICDLASIAIPLCKSPQFRNIISGSQVVVTILRIQVFTAVLEGVRGGYRIQLRAEGIVAISICYRFSNIIDGLHTFYNAKFCTVNHIDLILIVATA